jgi:hypothetical protein
VLALAIAGAVSAREPRDAWQQAGTALASATGRQLVRVAWMAFATTPACSPGEASATIFATTGAPAGGASDVSGVRRLYCIAARVVPAPVIERLAGMPVFLSGPHRDGQLDLGAIEFGRYNPAFVRWAAEYLLPGAGDASFRLATQSLYDRQARDLVRTYAAANRYFDRHPNELQRIAKDYQAAIDAAAAPRPASAPPAVRPVQRLSAALVPVAECLTTVGSGPTRRTKDGVDVPTAGAAAAFWVRREIDGTRDEFRAALAKLLDTYDAGFTPTMCAGLSSLRADGLTAASWATADFAARTSPRSPPATSPTPSRSGHPSTCTRYGSRPVCVAIVDTPPVTLDQ